MIIIRGLAAVLLCIVTWPIVIPISVAIVGWTLWDNRKDQEMLRLCKDMFVSSVLMSSGLWLHWVRTGEWA